MTSIATRTWRGTSRSSCRRSSRAGLVIEIITIIISILTSLIITLALQRRLELLERDEPPAAQRAPRLARPVLGGVARAVDGVGVGALSQQQRRGFGVGARASVHERRLAAGVGHVQRPRGQRRGAASHALDEELQHEHRLGPRREAAGGHHRRLVVALDPGTRALGEERLHGRELALGRGRGQHAGQVRVALEQRRAEAAIHVGVGVGLRAAQQVQGPPAEVVNLVARGAAAQQLPDAEAVARERADVEGAHAVGARRRVRARAGAVQQVAHERLVAHERGAAKR
mmetsp:Transcript_42794/g.134254  ORF Transcript_42794/g.134254 Transcript_42794/m.134254 type:complete len:286 (+) Transcript_42794:320-1177(+)